VSVGLVTTGTTLQFSRSSFLCSIIGLTYNGVKRSAINISGFAACQFEVFVANALASPGAFELDLLYNSDQVPPIISSPEGVYLTFTNGTVWAGTMFFEEFEASGMVEQCFRAFARVRYSTGFLSSKINTTPFIKSDDGTNILNDDGNLTYASI
jgi:hypothetical protein